MNHAAVILRPDSVSGLVSGTPPVNDEASLCKMPFFNNEKLHIIGMMRNVQLISRNGAIHTKLLPIEPDLMPYQIKFLFSCLKQKPSRKFLLKAQRYAVDTRRSPPWRQSMATQPA